MPKRHGLFRKIGSAVGPRCLFGINRVFYIIGHAGFHGGDMGRVKKIWKLFEHAKRVEDRLLGSLDLFQQEILKIEKALNEKEFGLWEDVTAGIAADAIINYLGMFIDDIGRLIPCVMGYNGRVIFDSFLILKNKIKKHNPPLFPNLRMLFGGLDTSPESWWNWALKYGEGVRQRVIHSTDFIDFCGTKREGDDRTSVSAYLWGEKGADYLNGLGTMFRDLFDWLDELQELLEQELTVRSKGLGFDWRVELKDRVESGGHIRLPMIGVEWKNGVKFKELPPNFLFFPICDGSDPFD